MRLLLLLLLALATAVAAPFLAYGVRPDMLPPGGGTVAEGWEEAWTTAGMLFEQWRGSPGQEGGMAEPTFRSGEERLRVAGAVVVAAAIWLVSFLAGGIVGLVLLGVRLSRILIAAGVLALLPFACKGTYTVDISPESERIARAVLLLAAWAALSGFVTVRSFRHVTI